MLLTTTLLFILLNVYFLKNEMESCNNPLSCVKQKLEREIETRMKISFDLQDQSLWQLTTESMSQLDTFDEKETDEKKLTQDDKILLQNDTDNNETLAAPNVQQDNFQSTKTDQIETTLTAEETSEVSNHSSIIPNKQNLSVTTTVSSNNETIVQQQKITFKSEDLIDNTRESFQPWLKSSVITTNNETIVKQQKITFKSEDLIDNKRESFQPWPNSSSNVNCSKFFNHFAQLGSFLPTVWLASYPGSGNTWLRYLIEGTTGFFTRGPDPIVSYSKCYWR
jgi:hypothetical protein